MKREIIQTKDNSKTLYIKELNENYHSHHGALQEAKHVFIDNGIKIVNKCEINILELGFGTGLNVLVSIDAFLKKETASTIHYFTIEKYPINTTEIENLNYGALFSDSNFSNIYKKIHQCPWETSVEIVPNFFLTKHQCDFFALENLVLPKIDLVYFDCFGARVQPDLWEVPLLEMVSNKMDNNGLFTTYSAKGSVRRNLQSLGFLVEKIPGPPGKREMINAYKKY